MSPLIVILLILLLAVVLIGLGIGLSRKSQRDEAKRRAPGERAPARPVTPSPRPPVRSAPPATAAEPETVTAPEPTEVVGEVEVGEEVELEAPVEEEVVEEIKPVRLRDRLGKTRAAFAKLRGRGIDDDTWDDLEDTLLLADVGVATSQRILDDVKARAKADKIADTDTLMGALHTELVALLDDTGKPRTLEHTAGEPNVWMFVGVNGVGKTTTIAKVAQRETGDGRNVVLAAADTFRAAAAEQLTHWAEVTGAGIVRGQEGADPGSVVFDAMAAAQSRDADLVLVDTAGRLHTKVNLMAELEKLRRIVDRTPGALKEVLLVLDATTGQNGLTQAKQFAEAVDVTGVVLTKLDGSAKGGIVLAIEAELGIPVKLIGVGETAADLMPFEPEAFVAALLDA
ncbi:MAG: signal recognition particle-docking protein FtsY [Acidimicrobiia bacterium]